MQDQQPEPMPSENALPQESGTSVHSEEYRQSGARVLIIDDEPEIGRALRTALAATHFATEWVPTGTQGLKEVKRWHPDVVILDLSLPDMDGTEVCRELRTWSQVPIIVLSVRSREADKIAALELGADDYLTKPFGMGELIARIRVALRHAISGSSGSGTESACFQAGGLRIDFERRVVTVGDTEVHLTPTEYAVLAFLARNAGKVVTHRTLLLSVWGPAYEDEAQLLRVFVGQLRRKLEPDPGRPQYLLTEPGIGYRLRFPDLSA